MALAPGNSLPTLDELVRVLFELGIRGTDVCERLARILHERRRPQSYVDALFANARKADTPCGFVCRAIENDYPFAVLTSRSSCGASAQSESRHTEDMRVATEVERDREEFSAIKAWLTARDVPNWIAARALEYPYRRDKPAGPLVLERFFLTWLATEHPEEYRRLLDDARSFLEKRPE